MGAAMTRGHLILSLGLMASSSLCFAAYPITDLPTEIYTAAQMAKQVNQITNATNNQNHKDINNG